MGEHSIYRDIAERTGGDIYIGVVGPVRTGKSTFIKRFMDLLVIPNIDNEYKRQRDNKGKPLSRKEYFSLEPFQNRNPLLIIYNIDFNAELIKLCRW